MFNVILDGNHIQITAIITADLKVTSLRLVMIVLLRMLIWWESMMDVREISFPGCEYRYFVHWNLIWSALAQMDKSFQCYAEDLFIHT